MTSDKPVTSPTVVTVLNSFNVTLTQPGYVLLNSVTNYFFDATAPTFGVLTYWFDATNAVTLGAEYEIDKSGATGIQENQTISIPYLYTHAGGTINLQLIAVLSNAESSGGVTALNSYYDYFVIAQ